MALIKCTTNGRIFINYIEINVKKLSNVIYSQRIIQIKIGKYKCITDHVYQCTEHEPNCN